MEAKPSRVTPQRTVRLSRLPDQSAIVWSTLAGGGTPAVLLEEFDDLGLAQPALLRLIDARLRDAERLDRARGRRIALGDPAEEPGRRGIGLVEIRQDIEVRLDDEEALTGLLRRQRDLRGTEDGAAEVGQAEGVRGRSRPPEAAPLDQAECHQADHQGVGVPGPFLAKPVGDPRLRGVWLCVVFASGNFGSHSTVPYGRKKLEFRWSAVEPRR